MRSILGALGTRQGREPPYSGRRAPPPKGASMRDTHRNDWARRSVRSWCTPDGEVTQHRADCPASTPAGCGDGPAGCGWAGAVDRRRRGRALRAGPRAAAPHRDRPRSGHCRADRGRPLCPLRPTGLRGPLRPAAGAERLSLGADHVRRVRRQPALQRGPDLRLAGGGPAGLRRSRLSVGAAQDSPGQAPGPRGGSHRRRSVPADGGVRGPVPGPEPVEQLRHRLSAQRPEHRLGAGVHRQRS